MNTDAVAEKEKNASLAIPIPHNELTRSDEFILSFVWSWPWAGFLPALAAGKPLTAFTPRRPRPRCHPVEAPEEIRRARWLRGAASLPPNRTWSIRRHDVG